MTETKRPRNPEGYDRPTDEGDEIGGTKEETEPRAMRGVGQEEGSDNTQVADAGVPGQIQYPDAEVNAEHAAAYAAGKEDELYPDQLKDDGPEGTHRDATGKLVRDDDDDDDDDSSGNKRSRSSSTAGSKSSSSSKSSDDKKAPGDLK